MRIVSALAAAALSVVVASQAHAVIVVDGNFDSDYGARKELVPFNASVPNGDFNGSPGSAETSYEIYLKYQDGNVYGFLKNLGAPIAPDMQFSNLYWDTNPSAGNGSDLGFELRNNRAFVPGVAGYSPTLTLQYASNGQAIEFAIPASYFTSGVPGLSGVPLVSPGGDIVLRLSQSFGYSVAGGETFGPDRLGELQIGAVPEPSTWAMMLIGFAGLGFMAYRRTCKIAAAQA